jgi:hypothetical protein
LQQNGVKRIYLISVVGKWCDICDIGDRKRGQKKWGEGGEREGINKKAFNPEAG